MQSIKSSAKAPFSQSNALGLTPAQDLSSSDEDEDVDEESSLAAVAASAAGGKPER